MTINNGAFEFSHGPTGYERSPTGKIEQWGQGVTDANGDINVVFPKRFPNACFNVAANHVGLGAAMVIVIHGSMTQDGVKLRAFNETGGTYPGWLVYWHATGK
ncbi:gp53-like domain-containing protein [Burkholderia sp. ABCPW 111]